MYVRGSQGAWKGLSLHRVSAPSSESRKLPLPKCSMGKPPTRPGIVAPPRISPTDSNQTFKNPSLKSYPGYFGHRYKVLCDLDASWHVISLNKI